MVAYIDAQAPGIWLQVPFNQRAPFPSPAWVCCMLGNIYVHPDLLHPGLDLLVGTGPTAPPLVDSVISILLIGREMPVKKIKIMFSEERICTGTNVFC